MFQTCWKQRTVRTGQCGYPIREPRPGLTDRRNRFDVSCSSLIISKCTLIQARLPSRFSSVGRDKLFSFPAFAKVIKSFHKKSSFLINTKGCQQRALCWPTHPERVHPIHPSRVSSKLRSNNVDFYFHLDGELPFLLAQ